MALPQFTMRELMEAGVHFGHRTGRWNPKMAPFIFGERNGIHVIDLQQTVPMMYTALGVVRQAVAGGGKVLFVGTKRQAQEVIMEAAERCGQYYINHRWLGGTLTNWKTINVSIKRLKELEDLFAKFAAEEAERAEAAARAAKSAEEGAEEAAHAPAEKTGAALLTKKERLLMEREFEKLQRALGGIKDMNGIPDVLVVVDTKKERIAIEEANRLGIPVIGIIDSNSDPDGVSYPIPGNDDASRALRLYARLMSDAVLDGLEAQVSKAQSGEAQPARGGSAPQRKTVVKLSPKAQAAAEAEAAEGEAAKSADAAKEGPKGKLTVKSPAKAADDTPAADKGEKAEAKPEAQAKPEAEAKPEAQAEAKKEAKAAGASAN